MATSFAAAVSHNEIKTLLASGLSTFFHKDKAVFSSARKSLLKNPPDHTILSNCVFDNFLLTEEFFTKSFG